MGDGRIVLFGNGSHENLGCQAIDIGTACGLAELGHRDLTFVPARPPFDADLVAATSGARITLDATLADALSSLRVRAARRAAAALPPSRRPGLISATLPFAVANGALVALALGGDNYTFDYGPPDVFFGVNRSVVAAGVPLVMWGASIGPFSADPEYERMAASELGRARGIFVREDVTAEYLNGLGLSASVVRMSDPAFLMPPADTLPAGIDYSGFIGFNISPLIGLKLGLGAEEWHARCASLVAALLAAFDEPIALVPHVTVADSDDRALLDGVLGRLTLAQRARTEILPPNLDARQTKRLIGQMRAFVGARTHATIAAMSQAVPTISLGYSAKAVGVNLDVYGHDRYVVAYDALDEDTLVERVGTLLDEAAVVHETLSAALPAVKERARAGFRALVARIAEVDGRAHG